MSIKSRAKETGWRAWSELSSLRLNQSESSIDGPDGLLPLDHGVKIISPILQARIEAIKFAGNSHDQNFSWQPEDLHVGLIVPFRFKHRYTPENVRSSLGNLARFITYNGLHCNERLKVVGGITHQPFAIASTRYGFHTAPVPVNPAINLETHTFFNAGEQGLDPYEFATAYEANKATMAYDLLGLGEGRPPERRRATFAYMAINEFLDTYAGPEAQHWRESPPRIHEAPQLGQFGYPIIPEHIKVRGR